MMKENKMARDNVSVFRSIQRLYKGNHQTRNYTIKRISSHPFQFAVNPPKKEDILQDK